MARRQRQEEEKEESVGQVVKEYSQDNYGEVVVTEVSDEIRNLSLCIVDYVAPLQRTGSGVSGYIKLGPVCRGEGAG